MNFIRVNAQQRYYDKLAGVTEPEAKRKIIGEEFIRIFEEEAKKMIRSVDEARDNYHMHYAGFLPSDPKHKTIMIDSSSLGVEGTAEYLVDFIQKKFDRIILDAALGTFHLKSIFLKKLDQILALQIRKCSLQTS